MIYVLDRFEEKLAVIERTGDGGTTFIKADRSLVSPASKEGDVLVKRNGRWETDKEQTARRREELLKKLRGMTK